ncbi:MAG TPA: cation transporter [Gammaproteobacteria bacterium]|jgi:cation diffusion facilitator family transporter|nr:cation transporter [Gammaproteobacteria bacterium]
MSASGSKKVIIAALIGNSAIAVTKFVAASITGSAAMMSEGIHSLVDTGNQGLLLYGLKQAKKPADEQFPFGHGKEIYFWSFVVAILIFAVGAGVSIYHGIHHVIHPEPMTSPMINYIVLGLAIIFESAALTFAVKEFNRVKGKMGYIEAVQRGKDPSLFVVVFEDSAALAGLFVALIGITLAQITGIAWFDGLASIIIGLILGATAIWLAIETKGLLIGESANHQVVQGIRDLAIEVPNINKIHEVLTMHMGPEFILVNINADFNKEVSAAEMSDAISALDTRIKQGYPEVKRVFVEAELRDRA